MKKTIPASALMMLSLACAIPDREAAEALPSFAGDEPVEVRVGIGGVT